MSNNGNELATVAEKTNLALPREAFAPAGQLSLQEIFQLAEVFHRSNAWPDVRTAAMCVVKILAGRELGFPAFASMSNVHIIDGKPSVGAHLRAAAIKRSDRYDFEVVEASREACELAFYERTLMSGGETRKGVGGWVKKKENVRMTLREAVENAADGSAGVAMAWDKEKKGYKLKANWRNHPDDMLFARCVSKGYRRYCADLSSGVLAYDPDELGELPAIPAAPAPAPAPARRATGRGAGLRGRNRRLSSTASRRHASRSCASS
jgi:hypothetical protein